MRDWSRGPSLRARVCTTSASEELGEVVFEAKSTCGSVHGIFEGEKRGCVDNEDGVTRLPWARWKGEGDAKREKDQSH
jgi:hypothetical protein